MEKILIYINTPLKEKVYYYMDQIALEYNIDIKDLWIEIGRQFIQGQLPYVNIKSDLELFKIQNKDFMDVKEKTNLDFILDAITTIHGEYGNAVFEKVKNDTTLMTLLELVLKNKKDYQIRQIKHNSPMLRTGGFNYINENWLIDRIL